MPTSLDPTVLVALIAAVPASLGAWAAYASKRISGENRQELRGNGLGTHTQMLELLTHGINDLKDWSAAHDRKHEATDHETAVRQINIPTGSSITIQPYPDPRDIGDNR